jgi:hypothetical protein
MPYPKKSQSMVSRKLLIVAENELAVCQICKCSELGTWIWTVVRIRAR